MVHGELWKPSTLSKSLEHTLGDPTIGRAKNYIMTVSKKRGLKRLKNSGAVSPSWPHCPVATWVTPLPLDKAQHVQTGGDKKRRFGCHVLDSTTTVRLTPRFNSHSESRPFRWRNLDSTSESLRRAYSCPCPHRRASNHQIPDRK